MTFLAGLAASILEWLLTKLGSFASSEYQEYQNQKALAATAAAQTKNLGNVTATTSATDTGKAINETLNNM